MSEFHCVVVKIENVEKHPNADSLSIFNVHGGYPCIFRTTDFNEGDLAAYIPVDAIVNLKDSRFAFLSDRVDKEFQRIKAKRLRGIFSMGLLIKADPSWELGQNVQEILGITKYEPEAEMERTGGMTVVGPQIPVYDLESVRKYKNLISENEEIVITEKLHGANCRFMYDSVGEFWLGSHRTFKKPGSENLWCKVADKYNLKEKLSKYPDLAFYGEVHGSGVQKGFTYGAQNGELLFRVFDIWNNQKKCWLDYASLVKITSELDLLRVPVLYQGPWSNNLLNLAEGQSTLGAHIREGCVIQAVTEQWDEKAGRKKLKLIGQGYHLLKE